MGVDYADIFVEEIQKRKSVIFPEQKDMFNDVLYRAVHNCIKILNNSDAFRTKDSSAQNIVFKLADKEELAQ